MNQIKPLRETQDTVTLSRADFDAMIEEMEDAEDRVAILQDSLNDMKPEQNRYLLTLAETMRIIDGENPVRVWREKRGMTVTQLANAVGLHDSDMTEIEHGAPVNDSVLSKLAGVLECSTAQLGPLAAAP